MRVTPAEGDLDDGVQLSDGRRITHQQAVPDQRTDTVKPDAELVDSGGVVGGHTAPRSTQWWAGCRAEQGGRGTSTTWGLYRKRVGQCCPRFEMVSRYSANG